MTEITYRDFVALPEIAIVIRLILIFVYVYLMEKLDETISEEKDSEQ